MAGRGGGWTWVYNDNKRRAGVEWFLSPSPVVCPLLPCERGRFEKGVVYGDGTYSRGLNEPCRSQTLGLSGGDGETVDPAWRGVGPWDELRAQREDETSILLVLLLLAWFGAVGVVAVGTLESGFCLPPPTSHNKQRVSSSMFWGGLGRQQMRWILYAEMGESFVLQSWSQIFKSSNAFPSRRPEEEDTICRGLFVGAAGFHSSRRFF